MDDQRTPPASGNQGRLVVITGGPGSGKTALLELVRRHFHVRVAVLPEAASILFGGGFPRLSSETGRRCAQRAIFFVQRQLERMGQDEAAARLVLCDRGTLDGLAYWPGTEASYFADVGGTRDAELLRYDTVIHLRVPPDGNGYNHRNPLRVESAAEAALLDERIALAWRGHPRRHVVDSTSDFLAKMARAIEIIRERLTAPRGEGDAEHTGERPSSRPLARGEA